MAARTLPRLPKLPKLSKLQALLLLGGAFVFGAAILGACRYDLYVDRSPAAPESSLFAATIDRASQNWLTFEPKLPERARQALSNAGSLKSVTLFAVPGAGSEPEWGLVEALSAVTERTARKKLRLVPKGTTVVGHIRLDGRQVPFQATITEGLIQARVGQDFRGLSFDSNPFSDTRRLLAPMHGQTGYVEKPEGVSWNHAADLLGAQLQRFQLQAGLWTLPGRLELAISASETHAMNPLVLYYRPKHGGSLAGPTLETYAKALLAESDPVSFEVSLPDDTEMIELRREPDSVLTTRKHVNQFGERAQLKAPGGRHQMEIFYAETGEAWLSDDLNRIQASIMALVSVGRPKEACEVGGRDGFVAISGKSMISWPFFVGFDRMTFSFHNMESGVFTTCGYFSP